MQSPSQGATRNVSFSLEGGEDSQSIIDSLPQSPAKNVSFNIEGCEETGSCGSPKKRGGARVRTADSLPSYSGTSPRIVRHSARWDSERLDVVRDDYHAQGWESENSNYSEGRGMNHVFTTVSYNALSEGTGTGTGFDSQYRSTGGSSAPSSASVRRQRKVRTATSPLEPTMEEGFKETESLGDRGVALVIQTFKNLKQSVIEVIRIEDLQVHFPTSSSPSKMWAVVEVCGKRRTRCLSWCRGMRMEVFGSFSITLHIQEDERNILGSLEGFSQDIRITRHARVRGDAVLDVRLFGEEPVLDNSRSRGNMLARYRLPIPPVMADDSIPLESDPIARGGFRRSKSNLSLTNLGGRNLGSRGVGSRSPNGGKSWTSECSHLSPSLVEGSYCAATIKMMDSAKVFDILGCKPKGNAISGSEWRPVSRRQWHKIWHSPWTDRCLVSQRRCIAAMMAEMKSDIVIFYQTLFAQSVRNPPPSPQMSPEEQDAHSLRILFLKRLVLCLAANRVSFCCEENGTARRQWPFPLVSALCHGSRILIRLDGVDWKAFVNFLMFGDEEAHDWGPDSGDVPGPLYKRLAATHAIGLHQNGRLYERKLNMSNTIKNIKDGITSHHLGMDLPLGGLGNRIPLKAGGEPLFVGPSGVPFRKQKGQSAGHEYVTDVQHGHLYLRWDEFPAATMPVIVSELVQQDDSDDEGPSVDAKMTEGTNEEDTWFHLPAFHSANDLRDHLESAGREPRDASSVSRFFKLLDKDGELTMQSNTAGVLRSRGILIHLVLEQEEDGVTKVLLHQEAHASLDDNSPDITAQDLRVAMTLRRRGELVDDAVARLCQVQLQLGVAAVDKVVDHCKFLMSGGSPFSKTPSGEARAATPSGGGSARGSRRENDQMFIYKTKPPPSLCYHHGCCRDCGVRVEYIAYRFTYLIRKQDRMLFHPILNSEFDRRERADTMIGFGCVDCLTGLGGSSSSSPGRMTRRWAWTPREEARRLNVLGLEPPSQRMRVLHETGRLSALLIGIENSAPLKEDCFGGKHSAAAVSKENSAFGTRKWRQYRKGGQEVPADIGGMHLEINAEYFNILKEMCRQCPLRKPEPPGPTELEANEEEKALFRKLLAGNDDSIQEVLSEFFQVTWPTHYQKAATQLLDCSIRERAASSSRLVTPRNSFTMISRNSFTNGGTPSETQKALDESWADRSWQISKELASIRQGDSEPLRANHLVQAEGDPRLIAEKQLRKEAETRELQRQQQAEQRGEIVLGLPEDTRVVPPHNSHELEMLSDSDEPQSDDGGQTWHIHITPAENDEQRSVISV